MPDVQTTREHAALLLQDFEDVLNDLNDILQKAGAAAHAAAELSQPSWVCCTFCPKPFGEPRTPTRDLLG